MITDPMPDERDNCAGGRVERQEEQPTALSSVEPNADALGNLARQALAHGVHSPPSVAEDPLCVLTRWRILELDGECYFVGYQDRYREGRVSGAIRKLDVTERRGTTRSGRQYVLSGPPGVDPDADHVLHWWLRVNEISPTDVRDVTTDLILFPTREEAP